MTAPLRSSIALTALLLVALTGCAAAGATAPSPSKTAARGGAATSSPAPAPAVAEERNCATIGVTVHDVAEATGLPFAGSKDVPHGCGYWSTPDAGGRTVTAEVLRLPTATTAAFEAGYTAMSGAAMSGSCSWEDARHEAFTCEEIVPAEARGLQGASQSMVRQNDHVLHLVVAANVPDFASTADHASRTLAQELVRRGL